MSRGGLALIEICARINFGVVRIQVREDFRSKADTGWSHAKVGGPRTIGGIRRHNDESKRIMRMSYDRNEMLMPKVVLLAAAEMLLPTHRGNRQPLLYSITDLITSGNSI